MGKNDFIFVKGKNFELSKFEIISYLDTRKYKYDILNDTEDFLIVRFLDSIDTEKMMSLLGGTLKIANVLEEIPKNELGRMKSILINKLDKIGLEKIFKFKTEKFIFGVSVYSNKDSYKIYKIMGNYFKKRLKQGGITSKYFGFPKKRKPQLTNVEVIKKNLVDNGAEIIVCISTNKVYIGITKTIHNPFEFQKRDIERPVQRTIFSISPRLSHILINLSGAKEGDMLLDQFCGIGTILQEALLNGIKILGVDIDEACIKSSKENLRWVSKEYKLGLNNIDERLIVGDARKLSEYFGENSIDAIATEPSLGPPLKKRPTIQEANKIFKEIKTLYTGSLKEMYKILKSKKRIAIVSPCIRITKSKYVKFDFASIVNKIGFKIISSFTDAERRHKTFREIFIIEKP